MEPAEEASASPAPAPVFVDDTGRRRVLTRRAGRILVIGFTAYVGLLVVGFARDPRVGPIHLPTFGLPSLGLVAPEAPSDLAEQAERTASDEAVEVATGDPAAVSSDPADRQNGTGGRTPGRLTPASGGGASPGGSIPSPAPAAGPAEPGTTTTTAAPTTTTARDPGHGSKSATTTTAAPSTTNTTATTTSSITPGQGSGQGAGQGSEQGTGSVSAQGPDGSGAPGLQRRTTTTTAG